MNRLLACSVTLAAAAVLLGGPAFATDDVRKSVVKIYTSQSTPNMFQPWEVRSPSEITGSGVVIEGGRILTNAHVVEDAHQIYVQPYESADKLDATVEFLSAGIDLATLKLDDPEVLDELKPVPLADALPPLKAKINVFGYPEGGDTLSITEGVVSRVEFDSYYYDAAALRIQVDAAINPGNSGGPGIVDGHIAGLVFSQLPDSENIGYLIPAEVIRHFLDDWLADGVYDGFPLLDVGLATVENPCLRRYLKLDKSMTGLVVLRVDQPELAELLRPGDVIMECDGVNIDDLGMVPLEDGVRVHWLYLVGRQPPGSTVKLALARDGRRLEVEVPTATKRNKLVQRMARTRPTYFVYAGLVFSPVTTELELAIPPGWFGYLGSQGRLLAKRIAAYRQQPDDEIVVTVCPILPHKLTKGYGVTRLSVVTHVNDQPVSNLRQMIGLIKHNTDEFIIFRFEDEQEERIVLDPEQVAKYSPEILRNNNIPSAVSEDLADVWP